MARPTFVVQQFLVCQYATWQGAAGPRTLRTLEGVGYYHPIPPDAEYPVLDLWAYLRLFLINQTSGRRRMWVEVYWLDAPGGERSVKKYKVGPVPFWSHAPVTTATVHLDRLMIPGRGRYEIRLVCRKRSRIYGREDRIVARDYIYIE